MNDAELTDFLLEFDEITNEVVGSRYQDFAQALRKWFSCLDDAPSPVSQRVAWLGTLVGFAEVESKVIRTPQGMAGSGQLNWPENREQRLGAQLALFREFASERINGWNFAHDYFPTNSSNVNTILHEMTQHLFAPHAAELRRYIARNVNVRLPTAASIPASDRFVPIDHNSRAYDEALAGLDAIGEAVGTSNEIAPDDKEQLLSEIDASKTLLKPHRVRREVVLGVVFGVVGWLASQFAQAAFAPVVQATLAALKSLFPGLPI